MPTASSPEKWNVCDYCGEIVGQSPDPYAAELYHSAACPERAPDEDQSTPAEQDASSAGPGKQELGTSVHGLTARALRVARALLPREQPRSVLPGLAMGAAVCIAVVAAIVLSGRPGNALPAPVSSPHPVPGTTRPTPGKNSPGPARPAPNPVPSPAPNPTSTLIHSGSTPPPAPTSPVVSVPPAKLVLNTFQGGTDGWMQEWGNISLTPTTQPAFDGASLLLTTSGDSNVAIGSGSDGTTSLKTGQTVTYHVWSSGEPGSVQAFIADDNNNIYDAASAELPSAPGWFTLTWTVPAHPSIEGIGLQVNNPYPGSSLTLAIGALSWPQN
jgi:hypothetical protein